MCFKGVSKVRKFPLDTLSRFGMVEEKQEARGCILPPLPGKIGLTVNVKFSLANKKKEPAICNTHISVSNTIPRDKDPFWPVMFPLSINSNKFSTEVLHTKFDLSYFVREMFN